MKKNFRIFVWPRPIIKSYKLTKEDYFDIKNKTYGKEIIEFKETLFKTFNIEDLNILKSNIKYLDIKEKNSFLKLKCKNITAGKYKPKENKISILKEFKNQALNHELFHMATTIYDEETKKIFSGFMQINLENKKKFGIGLNEGYTDYLTYKYFKNNNFESASLSYKICTFYAEKLEQIIGKEKMQSLYLNADLHGLITILLKYDEIRNICEFILALDRIIYKNDYGKDFEIPFKTIRERLLKWFFASKQEEIKEKKISKEKCTKDILEFTDSINSIILEIQKESKRKEYILK